MGDFPNKNHKNHIRSINHLFLFEIHDAVFDFQKVQKPHLTFLVKIVIF